MSKVDGDPQASGADWRLEDERVRPATRGQRDRLERPEPESAEVGERTRPADPGPAYTDAADDRPV